jgi:hypothetical protein
MQSFVFNKFKKAKKLKTNGHKWDSNQRPLARTIKCPSALPRVRILVVPRGTFMQFSGPVGAAQKLHIEGSTSISKFSCENNTTIVFSA